MIRTYIAEYTSAARCIRMEQVASRINTKVQTTKARTYQAKIGDDKGGAQGI